MTQQSDVMKAIITLIDTGHIDKSKIYSVVVENFKIPRPTVRRIAKNLIVDLEHKIKVLKGEITAEKTIQNFEELKKLETVTKAVKESNQN